MTVDELIARLKELSAEGHGDAQVTLIDEWWWHRPVKSVELVEDDLGLTRPGSPDLFRAVLLRGHP